MHKQHRCATGKRHAHTIHFAAGAASADAVFSLLQLKAAESQAAAAGGGGGGHKLTFYSLRVQNKNVDQLVYIHHTLVICPFQLLCQPKQLLNTAHLASFTN